MVVEPTSTNYNTNRLRRPSVSASSDFNLFNNNFIRIPNPKNPKKADSDFEN